MHPLGLYIYCIFKNVFYTLLDTYLIYLYLIFSHLADAFIQSDLQMRTTEAINCIKTTKTDPKLKAKTL